MNTAPMIEAMAKAIGDARRMRCGGYPSSGEGPDPWLTDEDREAAQAALSSALPMLAEEFAKVAEEAVADSNWHPFIRNGGQRAADAIRAIWRG